MIKYPEFEKAFDTLPALARKELLDFVGYLQYKYQADPSGPLVKLGGLWADVDFDVTHDDVRALRQRVTGQLTDKV